MKKIHSKTINTLLALYLPLFSCSLYPDDFTLSKSSVFAPAQLGNIQLMHNDNGFHVMHNSQKKLIQNCDVDPVLRNIKQENLQKLLTHGYLSVNKLGEQDYALRAHGRLKGGGPVLAAITYGGVKVIAYGGMLAGATTLLPSAGASLLTTALNGFPGSGMAVLTAATVSKLGASTTAKILVAGASTVGKAAASATAAGVEIVALKAAAYAATVPGL